MTFLDLFLYFKRAFYNVKGSDLYLNFNIFQQPSAWHTTKINFINLQTIDPDICPILTFQGRVWEQFLHHILYFIIQDKSFSCYIQEGSEDASSLCHKNNQKTTTEFEANNNQFFNQTIISITMSSVLFLRQYLPR